MLLTKALLHTTDSYIKRLKEAGIVTAQDIIGHYPRALENRSDIAESFSLVNIKEKNTIIATIESMTSERTRNGKTLAKMVLSDAHGFHAEAVWFTKPYFFANYHQGDRVKIFGKPKYEYGRLSFPSPEVDLADKVGPEFLPVYSDVNYIPGNWFREKMPYLRDFFDTIPDPLPQDFRKSKGFASMSENLRKIHFPASVQEFEEARAELAYRELFVIQYSGITRKNEKRRVSE